MSYGIRISLPLPTNGQVSWGGTVNDLFQAIIDCLAAQVTPSGIDVTSTLDIQGQAVIDVSSLGFTPSADPGTANSFFIAAQGSGLHVGELYVRDAGNNLIQVTSNGALNITTTGGFGGNYVSAGAVASYNSGNSTYFFTTDGSTAANIDGQNIVAHGSVTGSGGSFGSLQVTAATGLSGSTTVSGSLIVSGSIYCTPYTLWIPPAAAVPLAVATYSTSKTDLSFWTMPAGGIIDYPLTFPSGTRILQIDSWATPSGAAQVTSSLLFTSPALTVGSGNPNVLASRVANTGSGIAAVTIGGTLLTGTMPQVMNSTGSYVVRVSVGNVGGQSTSYGLKLTLDRPIGT